MRWFKFKKEGSLDIAKIREYANKYKWDEVAFQEKGKLVSFAKELKKVKVRINIYYNTITLSTWISHPSKGKVQLFKENASEKELVEAFKNTKQYTNTEYIN